jgi:ADP-heptose:LPS heptosyltransferase
MENILLINLRRLGDIYSLSHLISSLSEAKPHSKISLLVFEESAQAARNLKNIDCVYTVDRKHLTTLKVNKIFSDAMAIEFLFESLKPLKQSSWDNIINTSNDKASAFLSSYLSNSMTSNQAKGISYASPTTITYSSEWDIVLNEIVATGPNSPFQFIDCLHEICGVEHSYGKDKIKLNQRHEELSIKNIQKIKSTMTTSQDESPKTIGIQMTASHESKMLTDDVLIEIIHRISSDLRGIPILLIAPNEIERALAKEVNSRLRKKIVVVESDLSALASVVNNLDFLITPDTVTKHISDSMNTPCLELSIGQSPLYKQGSRNPNSLILTPRSDWRIFSTDTKNFLSEEESSQKNIIEASDVINTISYFFSDNKNSLKPELSSNVQLFRPVIDELGVNLVCIAGELNGEYEATRHFSRYLLGKSLKDVGPSYLLELVPQLLKKETPHWADHQKSLITQITRDLLGTLRALIQAQESRKKVKDFISSLDRLMAHANNDYPTSIFVKIFRAKIESLDSKQSFNENVRDVESLLYELKSDLQKFLLILKDVESLWHEHRKNNITNSRISKIISPSL